MSATPFPEILTELSEELAGLESDAEHAEPGDPALASRATDLTRRLMRAERNARNTRALALLWLYRHGQAEGRPDLRQARLLDYGLVSRTDMTEYRLYAPARLPDYDEPAARAAIDAALGFLGESGQLTERARNVRNGAVTTMLRAGVGNRAVAAASGLGSNRITQLRRELGLGPARAAS